MGFVPSPFVTLSLILLILLMAAFGNALIKCKCTQSSPNVRCQDGVCETGSSCLMLDHPHSGRHYACSSSDLREGECVEKTSKSGANVKVCSCNSSDFCNFKMWPDGREDSSDFPPASSNENSVEEAAETSRAGQLQALAFSVAIGILLVPFILQLTF